MPWVGLQCVIVVFPDHTHLLFKIGSLCLFSVAFLFFLYRHKVMLHWYVYTETKVHCNVSEDLTLKYVGVSKV